MALRNAQDVTIVPSGLSDSLDGTNTFPGAMSSLQDLCLSYGTEGVFAPRPAGTVAIDFTPINAAGVVNALITVGTRAYGWIESTLFPGQDQPFCYDFLTAGFVPIQNLQASLLPASPARTGDWVPPVVCAVTNSWILFLHPGYYGGSGPYFGWLDISSYTMTLTANTTAGSPVLTGVVTTQGSSAPILQGIQPGQLAAGAGLPDVGVLGITTESGSFLGLEGGGALGIEAGPYVVSCANGTFSLGTTGNTNGTTTVSGIANLTGVIPGMSVTGPEFATGTFVEAVGSGTVTLNQAALGTATGTSINFSGGGTITLSQSASATASQVSVTFNGGTYALPLWGAGNTNTNPLAAVPKAVAGFNGRAYFGAGPYLPYSDPLLPLQVSQASQALTIGDNTDITAIYSVPLTSQLTGGVQQSLTVFKGGGAVTQITGDAVTSNLAQNTVAGSVGTLAPNTISETPYGLAFIAVDGLRVLGLTGTMSEPIGADGEGVVVPFLNALYPSRMNAAYAEGIFRVTVQDGAVPSQPINEYWYSLKKEKWTGPHTCAMRMIAPYPSDSSFLGAPWSANGQGWRTDVLPRATSTYVENGSQLSWVFSTTLLPDNRSGCYNKVIQTNVTMALKSTDAVQVTVTDDRGQTLDSVNVSGSSPGGSTWGGSTWGGSVWGAASPLLRELAVNWTKPLVFRQMTLTISGASASGQLVGNIYAKTQPVRFNNLAA